MINILENHCIQTIAYKVFIICLSKCTCSALQQLIVGKLHANITFKNLMYLCSYV